MKQDEKHINGTICYFNLNREYNIPSIILEPKFIRLRGLKTKSIVIDIIHFNGNKEYFDFITNNYEEGDPITLYTKLTEETFDGMCIVKREYEFIPEYYTFPKGCYKQKTL